MDTSPSVSEAATTTEQQSNGTSRTFERSPVSAGIDTFENGIIRNLPRDSSLSRYDHDSHSGTSRGRGASLQSRRRTVGSLGLGVSFAFPLATPSTSEEMEDAASPTTLLSRAVSVSHSRRGSLSSSINGRHNSITTPPTQLDVDASTSTSRTTINSTPSLAAAHSTTRPSRRPSLSHLASFLSGIEHHTRVRTAGVGGGRGVSRSASRSTSRVGAKRNGVRERGQSFGSDIDSSSRSSSVAGSIRKGSLTFPGMNVPDYEGPDGERFWEEEESFSTTTPMFDLSASFSSYAYPGLNGGTATPLAATTSAYAQQTQRHIFHSPIVGRVLPTATNEEPFLDTAPSSPVPRYLQYPLPSSQHYYQSPQIHQSQQQQNQYQYHHSPTESQSESESHHQQQQQHHQQQQQHHHDHLEPSSSLEDVDVFEEGERIGVGVWLEDRGGWVRDCFGEGEDELGGRPLEENGGIVPGAPTEMEVVRRLGEGTYAIVYLVREVLYDPPDEDALSPLDSNFMFSSVSSIASLTHPVEKVRPPYRSWASDPFTPPAAPIYGRSFALKCLCKKDLSEELVQVQRGEAVLHRALPEHEYIVRLYGAYETNDWLFLVLEYCPGQDLFYWLDERQDSSVSLYGSRAPSPSLPPSSVASSVASPKQHYTHLDATASMEMETDRHSLSTKGENTDGEEDDVFSRTITQSTGAALMSAAHHHKHSSLTLTSATPTAPRAVRPSLNLSTVDLDPSLASTSAQTDTGLSNSSDQTPPSPSLLSSTLNEALLSRKRLRLISRMFGQMCAAVQACHEAGVAHRDIKPENFIVMDGRGERGESKRESARVVVKITDWGLGTREEQCEDFDCGSKPYMAYECRNNLQPTYDPRQADVWSLGLVLLNLLFHRNPWADPSLDDPDFADYVRDPIAFLKDRFEGIGEDVATFLTNRVFCDVLEEEADGSMRRRVTAGDFGKWAARLVMMMGEGKRKRASVSEHTIQLESSGSRPPGGGLATTSSPSSMSLVEGGMEKLEEIAEEVSVSPSTSLPPFVVNIDHATATGSSTDRLKLSSLSMMKPKLSPFDFDDDSPLPSPSFPSISTSSTSSSSLLTDMLRNSSRSPSPGTISPPIIVAEIPPSPSPLRQSATVTATAAPPPLCSLFSLDSEHTPTVIDELATEALKAKRRKRGARKGKGSKSASATIDTPVVSSVLPTAPAISSALPHTLPILDAQREKVVADLAIASQDLARELSKKRGTQSMGAISSSSSFSYSNYGGSASEKKSGKSSGGGVFERMKSLVKDGNPDLQAFKHRVEAKHMSFGNSAPAKMQQQHQLGRMSEPGVSSRGSVASWASHSGGEMDDQTSHSRGSRTTTAGANDMISPPAHWSSSSSRRERLDKRRPPLVDFSPTNSLTRNGTTTTSSGFSTHSNVERDWRATAHSISTLPSKSVAPSTTTTPSVTPLMTKPNLTNAATDTHDLPTPVVPTFIQLPTKPTSTNGDLESKSLSPPLFTVPTPPTAPSLSHLQSGKSNKLAKLLQGISVFNRTHEKPIKD